MGADAAGRDELVVRRAEVDGRVVDVRIVGGTVTEVGAHLHAAPGADLVDGAGGALIPGLHDHHIHLLAAAAADGSVPVGPREVHDRAGLARALHEADLRLPAGRWLRAIGYHESVAGDLDRTALDALVPHRPTRLQHRGGARWVLNTAAITALELDDHVRPELERDDDGRLTGRLHRGDGWLRSLLPAEAPPHLTDLGRRLARAGVTGLTDATPYTEVAGLEPIRRAVEQGSLPQRVWVMGGPELAGVDAPEGLHLGPVKLIVDDGHEPTLEDLAASIAHAHAHDRNVAIHCVTRVAIVLALAAWDVAGSRAGDRVEHGSVIPPELLDALGRHQLTVVTQPGFVAERGDEYLADVDADDLPHLYPCASLLDAGLPVAGSTDAPYTAPDPWAAIRAAVERRTSSGELLGAHERVSARRALGLFLGAPHAPGGAARRIEPGAPADLCLLHVPLEEALRAPSSGHVAHTIVDGRVVI